MSDVDRYIVGAMFMTNAEYRGPKRMHERVVVLHTDHVAAIQAARTDERERAAARVEELPEFGKGTGEVLHDAIAAIRTP